jgi:hypothetical protein
MWFGLLLLIHIHRVRMSRIALVVLLWRPWIVKRRGYRGRGVSVRRHVHWCQHVWIQLWRWILRRLLGVYWLMLCEQERVWQILRLRWSLQIWHLLLLTGAIIPTSSLGIQWKPSILCGARTRAESALICNSLILLSVISRRRFRCFLLRFLFTYLHASSLLFFLFFAFNHCGYHFIIALLTLNLFWCFVLFLPWICENKDILVLLLASKRRLVRLILLFLNVLNGRCHVTASNLWLSYRYIALLLIYFCGICEHIDFTLFCDKHVTLNILFVFLHCCYGLLHLVNLIFQVFFLKHRRLLLLDGLYCRHRFKFFDRHHSMLLLLNESDLIFHLLDFLR